LQWPLLVLLWLLATVIAIITRPLLPVDETRYFSVAWEMWQRQDFLVPYLNGVAYSHKPPLLFWLVHTVWSITGVYEWSARLIPPVLALIVLLQSVSLAQRLWPALATEINVMTPWLLLGGWFFILFMTLVQFDLLLTVMVLLAWQGLLLADNRQQRGWLVTGIGLGLGVLAKGPVVFLFVVPVALLAPWWRSQHTRRSWYLGLIFSLLLAAFIALGWAVPAGLAGGQVYQDAIFWGQSAGRVVDSFAHRSPWWLYIVALPLMLLPWILWPAVWRALSRVGATLNEPGTKFIIAVVLPALIIFSLISGKQPKYLLPILPLLILLLARILVSVSQAHNLLQTVKKLTLSSAVLLILLHLVVVPMMRPAYDLTAISQRLADLQSQDVPVAHLGKYHGQFHFLGRLKKAIAALPFDQNELRVWLEQNPHGYLVMYDRHLALELPESVFSQPYRSGKLTLWPVEFLLNNPQHLDALLANA
jgi:4-amino-4-deoxy-L-arabinose transferase-like glycosyltransferase